jgi:hypothetical protein
MNGIVDTTVPTTPFPWVSSLFGAVSPSGAPLRAAVFTPSSTDTLGGVTQNNSPSDQGSPTTTIQSPVSQQQWPSSSATTAFMKSYRLADPIEELMRSPSRQTNTTGSGTGPCRIPPPTMLAGSRMPLDFGSHRRPLYLNVITTLGSDHFPVRMPFPVREFDEEGEEELEVRPAKRQKGEEGHSTVTKVRRNSLQKVRQEKKALRGEVKSGQDPRPGTSRRKQPRTKSKPQQAAKKSRTELVKRNARPEARFRTRRGVNAK